MPRRPSSRSFIMALRISLYEVRANCERRTKPIFASLSSINEVSMLCISIGARVTSMLTSSSSAARLTPNITRVPRLPRIRRTMESCGIFCPATTLPSIFTMRSPGRTPASDEGPLGITLSTVIVSVEALKTMPMPSNSPSNDSLTSENIFAGIYSEWGSSSESNAGMAFS